MATQNPLVELENALKDFKAFLDTNVPKIKPAFQKLTQFIPQLKDLVDKLADLMKQLKTEVQNLNIPGIGEVPALADKTKAVLHAAKNALPGESTAISQVLAVADTVRTAPSLDSLKNEITSLIEDIAKQLTELKQP